MYRYLSKDPTPLSKTLELDGAPHSSALDAALNHLLDLAQDILEVPSLLIWFIDAVHGPRLQTARGLDLDIFSSASAFCSAVLSAKGVLVFEDAQDAPQFLNDPVLAAAKARFCAGVPIQADGDPIGGFGVLDAHPRTLSPRQRQTLQHLAHLAADAWILRNQGHAEREARYRAYFEHSVEGIWCYDFVPPVPLSLPREEQSRLANARAHLTECNNAMARMYGFENAAQLATDDLTKRLSPYTTGNLEIVQAFIESGYRATTVETLEPDRYGSPPLFLKERRRNR